MSLDCCPNLSESPVAARGLLLVGCGALHSTCLGAADGYRLPPSRFGPPPVARRTLLHLKRAYALSRKQRQPTTPPIVAIIFPSFTPPHHPFSSIGLVWHRCQCRSLVPCPFKTTLSHRNPVNPPYFPRRMGSPVVHQPWLFIKGQSCPFIIPKMAGQPLLQATSMGL